MEKLQGESEIWVINGDFCSDWVVAMCSNPGVCRDEELETLPGSGWDPWGGLDVD